MGSTTVKISAMVAVIIIALMLIGFVLEIVTADQMTSTLGKTLLVIFIVAISTMVISFIGQQGKKR